MSRQRGDDVAYIFEGKQPETYPDERHKVEVLATIAMSAKGWTDLMHIRLTGENWTKTRRKRCRLCGAYS